jgi:hypothetical protein
MIVTHGAAGKDSKGRDDASVGSGGHALALIRKLTSVRIDCNFITSLQQVSSASRNPSNPAADAPLTRANAPLTRANAPLTRANAPLTRANAVVRWSG